MKRDKRSQFLNSIPGNIIDQEAFTIEEICELKNLDRYRAEELSRDNVRMGSWERVKKRGKCRLQAAYRLKG